MQVLQCDQVGLEVRGHRLLQGISFALDSGEVLGIAGRNGAGKSSLLRAVSGEARRMQGSVSLRGQPLHGVAPRERARHLAMLPQSSSLQFDYRVRDIVALGRIPHAARNDESVIDRVLDECDLRDQAAQSYLTLSGGERQRVQLARVLAQLLPGAEEADLSGQLLLLDEPTNAMDIPHQEHFLALFSALRARGCAILLVLHDLNLLARCADRLLFLRDGEQLALGSTAEMLTEKRISELYDYPLCVWETPGGGTHISPQPHALAR